MIWQPLTFPPPPLHTTHLHLFRARLDIPRERLADLLSPEEEARAGRFHFGVDRQRYVMRRALLRLLIGGYLTLPPAHIEFAVSEFNRPYLPASPLNFNLSFSGDLALYAFALDTALGVDLEAIEPFAEMHEVAARTFAPGEVRAYEALPPADQPRGFFNCWTRKEAFIKAVGEGLSYPLDAFEVSLAPGEEARLRHIHGDSQAARAWTLLDLDPDTEHCAALAVYGQDWHITCFDLR